MAVEYLAADDDRLLTVDCDHKMKASELLELTAKEMRRSPTQYLERMKDPKEWGGGCEIVVLANALKRPICLYELKPVGMLFWSR